MSPCAKIETLEDVDRLQSWVHDFAASEIRPVAAEWDRRSETPWPILERAAEVGIYGLDLMASVALHDPTGLGMCALMEELFWGDAGIGLSLVGTALAGAGIVTSGTPEQVAEWLPKCYLGENEELALGAFAASEYEAGSDVSRYRTRAAFSSQRDIWTINGTKAWVTNGGIADVHVVVAMVEPALGARGQAAFIIPKGTVGLTMGRKYDKHGLRASHTAEVVLDDVEVPSAYLLGGTEALDGRLESARQKRSHEVQPAMQAFAATRAAIGAQALGIGRAALEYATEYACSRRAFGSRLAEKQAISFMLADIATEYEACRALVREASSPHRVIGRSSIGSMAKLKAARFAVWATERGMQILGAQGYLTADHPMERWHRDSKVYNIFEGSEQIQQLLVARDLTGLRIE